MAVLQERMHQGSLFYETGDGETERWALKLSRSDWKGAGGQAARSRVFENFSESKI